jgi:hypothetical protein
MAATPPTDTNALRIDYRLLGVLVTIIVVLAGGWLNAGSRQSKADERIALLEAWKIEHIKQSSDLLTEIRAKQQQQDKVQADGFNAVAAMQAKLQETLFSVQIEQAKH